MNQSRTVKKYIVFLGLTFFLFPLSLQASSVKVLTSFDKRTVSVDDKITMSIKVVGVGAANLQRPRLPQFEDFLTHYEGRSSNFSFVEGNSVRTVTFKYVLIPQKVGDFTISPFDVSVEGATYRTAPIAIKVISLQHTQPIGTTTAQTAAVSSQHTQPSPVSSPLPTVPQHKKTLPKGNDENLFVQIVPDKAEVYPYEQLTITYIMYTRRNLRYEGFEKEPETLGFWVEDLTDKEKLVREEVSLEGRNYMKAEVRKLALFPTRSGEFTIKPTVVKCSVQITDKKDEKIDDFFKDNFFGNVMTRREERLLETPSLDITVLPFPKENKPLGFKGMSGDYRMNVAP
ncbi:MAG: BatD family protein [Candidatus Omnitrophota bacterium]